MARTVGQTSQAETGLNVLAHARTHASAMPDLLLEAKRIANTVTSGWHGKKRRGSGDSFWQFRPYDSGESMARIDWRRSARDEEALYIRDQEWEAAHTVWVWADSSPSMLYQSAMAPVSKQYRGLVLAFALIDILAKSGERVGWPGISKALANKNAAEQIAAQLSLSSEEGENTSLKKSDTAQSLAFPPTQNIASHSEMIIVSDFLEPTTRTIERLHALVQQGVKVSLVHIIDPAEQQFPFTGRTEFSDPETGQKITFGKAQTISDEYTRLFTARQYALQQQCQLLGCHYIVHHTDTQASSALMHLYTSLSEERVR